MYIQLVLSLDASKLKKKKHLTIDKHFQYLYHIVLIYFINSERLFSLVEINF